MRRDAIVLFAVVFLIGLSVASWSWAALLPEGFSVESIYRRGIGSPIGEVKLVQGEVYIIHRNEKVGFRARKGLPVFRMDTVVTLDRGRALLEMEDDSRFTLASRTKLQLSRSVYNPKKKERSSFLKMALGKARFFVKKLAEFKNAEFRVKTPTAVVGVRGSDWVMQVTETVTEVTTLEDTELEVINSELPEDVRLMGSLQSVTVQEFEPPSMPEDTTPEEAGQLMRDLPIDEDQPAAGGAPEVGSDAGKEEGGEDEEKKEGGEAEEKEAGGEPEAKEGDQAPAEEEQAGAPAEAEEQDQAAGQEPAGEAPAGEAPAAPAVEEPEILVSEDELIEPEGLDAGGGDIAPPEVDFAGLIEETTVAEDVQQTIDDISQELGTDTVVEAIEELQDQMNEPLPDFPSHPEQ